MKEHLITRLLFAMQCPRADRLIRLWVKRMLHLNIHTPDASTHASVRDEGLGIMELRSAVPNIVLKRLVNIRENDLDQMGQRFSYTDEVDGLMRKLASMAASTPHFTKWRDMFKEGPLTAGLEIASESAASRSWVDNNPRGWSVEAEDSQSSNGRYPIESS